MISVHPDSVQHTQYTSYLPVTTSRKLASADDLTLVDQSCNQDDVSTVLTINFKVLEEYFTKWRLRHN